MNVFLLHNDQVSGALARRQASAREPVRINNDERQHQAELPGALPLDIPSRPLVISVLRFHVETRVGPEGALIAFLKPL